MSGGVLVVGAGSLGSVYGGAARPRRRRRPAPTRARRTRGRSARPAGSSSSNGGAAASSRCARSGGRSESSPPTTVIVLTKTPDTDVALAGLGHVREGVTLAVSLQNGVEKDDVLARWCGAEAVVGGVSMVGGTLLEPGVVAHTLPGTTILGELPRGRERAGRAARGGAPSRRARRGRERRRARRRVGEARPRLADDGDPGARPAAVARLPRLGAARRALRDARPGGGRDRRRRRASSSTTSRSATRCARSPPRPTTTRSRSSGSGAVASRRPG